MRIVFTVTVANKKKGQVNAQHHCLLLKSTSSQSDASGNIMAARGGRGGVVLSFKL